MCTWELLREYILKVPSPEMNAVMCGDLLWHWFCNINKRCSMYFTLLHSTDTIYILYIESCGALCQTCLLASFSSNICVESLCYILEIITIFQIFSLVSYLLWWSVMSLLCWELFWGTMNHTHVRFNQRMLSVSYLLHQPALPPSLCLPWAFLLPQKHQYWNYTS